MEVSGRCSKTTDLSPAPSTNWVFNEGFLFGIHDVTKDNVIIKVFDAKRLGAYVNESERVRLTP